jgi:hypothetical protein
MNIRNFWLLTTVVCLSMILVFSVAGCRGEVASEGAAKEKLEPEETLELLEKPDKELFDKYFSDIGLGGWSDEEKNITTLLPHGGTWFGVGFKNKKNFIFRIAVLNLETNDFVEKCATTASSQGSDGLVMEALEWAFLRPGSYEYRVYVEDTFIAALPFEVISYIDYFKAGIDKAKSSIIKNILRQ